MTKDITINQHYVPQSYLKAFSDEQQRCYIFDKQRKCYFLTGIRNILAKRYLYDFPKEILEQFQDAIEFIDAQSIEKILGQTVDNAFTDIVENIYKSPKLFQPHYSGYFLDIYRCIAIQILRTPTGMDILKKVYAEVYNSDFTKFETAIFAKELLDILSENPAKTIVTELITEFGHICIGINNTGLPLITNDRPISAVHNVWRDNEKMLYYPITTDRCLFFMKHQHISNQLNTVLDEVKKGAFSIVSINDIVVEAYKREKNMQEKLNPSIKSLDIELVHMLNQHSYDVAERFVVAKENIYNGSLQC